MKKICIKCGAEFETQKPHLDKTLCDSCAAGSLNRTVLREKICIDCGAHFIGYPRSLRCKRCKDIHQKELSKAKWEREKAGKIRPIGSIDCCVKCGKEYTVNSGTQRYCPECAPEEIKNNERAKSREWARENIDYDKRQRERRQSVSEIPCVICGKMFKPHGKALTCSFKCSADLHKRQAEEWERANAKERNAYHTKKNAEKLAAMTDEERKEYQEKINGKARENYRKRKEREVNNVNITE